MGCFGFGRGDGCGNDSCLWIIIIIIVLCCCCGGFGGAGSNC